MQLRQTGKNAVSRGFLHFSQRVLTRVEAFDDGGRVDEITRTELTDNVRIKVGYSYPPRLMHIVVVQGA